MSTGKYKNIEEFLDNNNFKFIEGDIRDLQTCINSTIDCDYVLHQAALGSVPRSISDPIESNDVNIGGFLNILMACKENNIKRVVYAASSSTYGDSKDLPKVENNIGKPLSPYAITKYVNELYADVFKSLYNVDSIGLRYFNVFGKKQDTESVYAAVIPLFIKNLINGKQPKINGDGYFSRDFTHIDNVVHMNLLALTTSDSKSLNQIYNTAVGERTTLNELVSIIKKILSKNNPKVLNIKSIHRKNRDGDIPHSLASIDKAKKLLQYRPINNLNEGLLKA